MAGEIVNLRRVRKARARVDKEAQAAENRAKHGRTKAERERDAIEKARIARTLDGARRHTDDGRSGDDER